MMRFKHLVIIAAALLALCSCRVQPQSAADVVGSISLVDSMRKIEGDTFFTATYELWFAQPVNHSNPNEAFFPQRVFYSHKGFDRPTVVVLEGYKAYSPSANELTKLLNANQIVVEHRFFEQSRPKDSIPWAQLTVKQAAADQHAIIQAFKPFYKGKWISTGISKGGQTTIFHRYFYPDDVDVSVPYVAPLNFSNEDERIYAFLDSVGTPECRQRIAAFQTELFKRKEALMPMLDTFVANRGYTFIMGIEKAYDLNVLEYQFAFWQWGGVSSESIPTAKASNEDLFKHWVSVAPFDFFADQGVADIRPFFYQAMTEIGMYGYRVKPWANYIDYPDNLKFDFTMPKGHRAVFHPETMLNIDRWLKERGNNMLYIYGQNDPWSATSVVTGSATNAVKMVNPGGDHTTRIKSFPAPMRDSIVHTLERWLDLQIERPSSGGGNPKDAASYMFEVL
ncbi:MAG: S28 family serine protease [Tenuifilaceae bacterium]|nr:S28 family serine protease [Tenuifilaceae bacterium]